MKFLLPLILLFVATPAANANVGLPIVVVGVPFMLAHLVVVILIETFILRKLRKDLPKAQTLKQVTLANLITTFIGYPVVAILEGFFPFVGLNIGWLIPFSDLGTMYSYVGTIMMLSLIPCYFLSIRVEGRWLRKHLSNDITKKDIYLIHTASYIYLIALSYLYGPLLMGRHIAWLIATIVQWYNAFELWLAYLLV